MTTKRENASRRSFPGQHDDEEVLEVRRQFPVVLRWPLIWGLIIMLIAMLPWSISTGNAYSWQGLATNWMWIVLIVLLLYWIWHGVGYYYSLFILTTRQVIVIRQRGFFNRKVSSLSLNNIQTVNYEIDGFQAALFGFGDVLVETLSGSGHLRMRKVHHPTEFQRQILEATHKFGSTAKPS